MTSGDDRARIDALRIKWFCTHAMDGYLRLDRWLATVRSELPEALPVRYRNLEGSSTFDWSERMLFRDAAAPEEIPTVRLNDYQRPLLGDAR
jgi:hypothetical protein